MNDCPRADIRDLLPDWVHGTLSPEARAGVAAHLAGCDACSAEVELLRAARAVMAQVPPVDMARILAAVAHAQRPVPKRRSAASRSVRAASGLALAASLIGVAILARTHGSANLPGDTLRPVVPENGAARTRAEPPTPMIPASGGELQLGAIGELRDDELRSLLQRLDRVEALPPESPEPVTAAFVEGTP